MAHAAPRAPARTAGKVDVLALETEAGAARAPAGRPRLAGEALGLRSVVEISAVVEIVTLSPRQVRHLRVSAATRAHSQTYALRGRGTGDAGLRTIVGSSYCSAARRYILSTGDAMCS